MQNESVTVAELLEFLGENDYLFLRYVPGRGICGLQRMLYTTGLFYGLDWYNAQGRYCYESKFDALRALDDWDGTGDPSGDWIRHKGVTGEYSNPNYIKE